MDFLEKLSKFVWIFYVIRALVKYCNDYLDIQSSGRRMGGVTYLYVGDVFIMLLGSKNANLLQKITLDSSRVMLQIFHCSKVFIEIKIWKKILNLLNRTLPLLGKRVQKLLNQKIGLMNVIDVRKNSKISMAWNNM